MPRISPFEKYAEQYERWFEKNRWVYEAELRAVKAMMPTVGIGLEIGVGTGRFAGPFMSSVLVVLNSARLVYDQDPGRDRHWKKGLRPGFRFQLKKRGIQ